MNCQYHGQHCGGRLGDAKASLGRPPRFQSVPGSPSRPSPVVDNYRPGPLNRGPVGFDYYKEA
eukprot:5457609-Heterocapsa_arctica.AAC.1